MKYDKKYPNAPVGANTWADAHRGVFKLEEAQQCMVCYEPTQFVDVHWHGRICSDECDMKHGQMVAETLIVMSEAERVSGTLHEFEPDDESAMTASCNWCGKGIISDVANSDPVFQEECPGRKPLEF